MIMKDIIMYMIRSWCILHHPMHRHVREDWHEDSDLQCSSTGGRQWWSSADDDDDIYDDDKHVDDDADDSSGDGYEDGDDHQNVLQILTKDSVTVFVNAIMYFKVSCHVKFPPPSKKVLT